MQVILPESEIKQAITDYLSRKFVAEIEVADIIIAAGLKTKEVTATVDLVTTSVAAVRECQCATKNVVTPVVTAEFKPVVVHEVVKTVEPVVEKEVVVPVVKEDTPTPVVEPVAVVEEEAPIVEGENVMTENFDLATVAETPAPIVDDVEDLFAN